MDLDTIPETPPAAETTPAVGTEEPATPIEVSAPAADDNRSFMDTFIEEAASQMDNGVPKEALVKEEPKKEAATEKPAPTSEKAKVETPESTKADVTEKPEPKGMSKEASRVFRELKEELKQARQSSGTFQTEKKALETRIAELESTSGDVAKLREEIKTKDARLAEQQQAIDLIRVESSDIWKKEVAGPMSNIVAEVSKLAKEYELSESELLAAVTTNNKRRLDEILSDLPEYDRFEAHNLRKQYAGVIAHRDDLQKSGSERLAQAEEEQRQRETLENEQYQQERHRQISTTLPNVEKNVSRFLETDADRQRMAKAMEIAKSDTLHTYPAHVQAGAVVAVAALPILIRRLDAITAENAQLKSDLSGFRASDPGAGGGGQKKPSETTAPYDENDSFEAALEKSVRAGR